jgi:hypothetical protein
VTRQMHCHHFCAGAIFGHLPAADLAGCFPRSPRRNLTSCKALTFDTVPRFILLELSIHPHLSYVSEGADRKASRRKLIGFQGKRDSGDGAPASVDSARCAAPLRCSGAWNHCRGRDDEPEAVLGTPPRTSSCCKTAIRTSPGTKWQRRSLVRILLRILCLQQDSREVTGTSAPTMLMC